MSYEHMKPLRPEYHDTLAGWVRGGGILVYLGDDADAFHGVREWWNDGKGGGTGPRADLFRRLGMQPDAAPGIHAVGKGWVSYTKAAAGHIVAGEGRRGDRNQHAEGRASEVRQATARHEPHRPAPGPLCGGRCAGRGGDG